LQKIETSIVSPDGQFTVFLDDVEVGEDALIGTAGNGLRQVFAGLNPSGSWSAPSAAGSGDMPSEGGGLRKATPGVVHSDRRPPGIAHPLAEAHIAVELGRLATIRSAELFDAGQSPARPPTSPSSPRPKLP